MSKLLSAYVGLEEKYALSTRELARRAEQMRIINEVGRRILSIRRLDDLLPFVTRVLYDTFNCYSVGVWLKEDASKALVMKAYADDGEDDGADQPLSFAYGERSVVVWVVEHGEPALVNDVDSDERYRSMPGSERVAAELAV
ncbi:MAG: GAF domain-containing protein, partial [Chloroflexia bacterium]